MCRLLQIFLHISSLAPAMLIATFRALSLYSIDSKRTIFCFIVFLVLFLTPLIVLKIIKKSLQEEPFKATSIELLNNTNSDQIGPYLLAYISPSLKWFDACLGFILFCIVIIIMFRNTISFHPYLNIWGYRCYRISNSKNASFILLSKRIIKNAEDVSAVCYITDLMLLDFVSEEI